MQRRSTFQAVSNPALPEGFELLNYVIERKLGQGGFGITYLAKEAVTGYRVVIKEAFPYGYVYREPETYRVLPNPEFEEEMRWALDIFQKEACTLRAFAKHENIVQVNSVFCAQNTGYIVLDFIQGKPLSELYPAGTSIEKSDLVYILLKLLRALEQLHARGIVHRDIKPANIMMSAGVEPVLIDFGAARPVMNTGTATQIGTPGYAPPEQISQTNYDKHPKPHIDLYALGATCYRLITGNEPDYVPYKLANDARLCSKYGADLLRSIDRARELLPAERWQSAAEWMEVLTTEPGSKQEEKHAEGPPNKAADKGGNVASPNNNATDEGKTSDSGPFDCLMPIGSLLGVVLGGFYGLYMWGWVGILFGFCGAFIGFFLGAFLAGVLEGIFKPSSKSV